MHTTTDRKPTCHWDRTLQERVTRRHTDDCPTHTDPRAQCPGRDGCQPCTEHHCVLCGRAHLDTAHALTCDECIGGVREDLNEILWLCRHLRWQAARGAVDGKLLAAAPIPGGDAMVMIARAGESTNVDDATWGRPVDEYHRPGDPIPPLLPLAAWNQAWRAHLGHRLPAKPSVTGTVRYLQDQLTVISQHTGPGPDWLGFAADMTGLRRQLEAILHDEQNPEQGVGCFECGRQLVRRFGKANPCRHQTPARKQLAQAQRDAAAARTWLQVLRTYPELGDPTWPELLAAKVPESLEHAARVPCAACASSRAGQGGIEDPSVGQSWECLGCRKRYTPGEYANAVRADLLTSGPNGDGWTHIAMAAEAASTQTGIVITAGTVRKWAEHGKVPSVCRWSKGARLGLRLVFWPDVADQAAAAVRRHWEAEQERQRRAKQAADLQAALLAGDDPEEAAKRLGIHPARAVKLLQELDLDGRIGA